MKVCIKNNSKRIAFLIGSMGKGGAERVISVIANDFANKGWKVDILLLLDDNCAYNLHKNINLIPICDTQKSRIKQLPYWLKRIRTYAREKSPHTIVSFVARINIITLLACIGMKKNIIVSERNDPSADGRSSFVKVATYLLYPLSNCIVFQTKRAKHCFPSYIRKNSMIIPNPINVNVKHQSDIENKIVSVGRLIEQKNHSMLIDAFQSIHQMYPDFKLCIYGEGKLRERLQRQIEEYDLKEFVDLPGNITNIHEEIANAKMFVLPSNYEGLSNALLEAMSIGLPCISTNCAGSDEVIKHNYNGKLISIGNTAELIESMKELIENDALSKEIRAQAKESSKKFNSVTVLKKWEKILT